MNGIKYIAFDMDGTLLNDNLEIMPKTLKCLIDLQEKGIKIIISTGRPLQGVLQYIDQLQLEKYGGFIINNNGANIYDVKNNKEIFEDKISVLDAKKSLKIMKNYDIHPFIREGKDMFVENVFGPIISSVDGKEVFNAHMFESRLGGFLLTEVHDLESFIDFPVSKIMAVADPRYIYDIYHELKSKFNENVYCIITANSMLEFVKNGINKGNALKILNIKPEELMAFGDGSNDLEMLKYAKYGIAMKNGMQIVKDISYDITENDNNNEGIYNYLLDFGLISKKF